MTENEKSTKKEEYKKVETYFILLYQRKEKENENDLKFTDIKEAPKCIHRIETQENVENQENPIFFYIKVFKFIRKQKKKILKIKSLLISHFNLKLAKIIMIYLLMLKTISLYMIFFKKQGKKC